MQSVNTKTMAIEGKPFEYRIVQSKSARKLRVRVGPNGIEVVQPLDRTPTQVDEFLKVNQAWISNQLKRIDRLQAIRSPIAHTAHQILFRGHTTPVVVEENQQRKHTNRVTFTDGMISITCAKDSPTLPVQSLENWLRKEAKTAIMQHVDQVAAQVGKTPNCVLYHGTAHQMGELLSATKFVV